MDLRPEEVSAIIKQQIDKYGNNPMWMMWAMYYRQGMVLRGYTAQQLHVRRASGV